MVGSACCPVMELTEIPGIGAGYSERLTGAGVADVAALAAHGDLDALAESTGIPRARLGEFAEAAKRMAETPTTATEPGAGPDAGHEGTGGPATTREAAEEVVMAVRQAAEEMRVVLKERANTARVRLQGMWHEDVPIVPAREADDQKGVAETLKRNAVILREKTETAVAVINDEVHENLPIFQERLKKGAEEVKEEVRVRVTEVRERAARSDSAFGRLFGRKDDDAKPPS